METEINKTETGRKLTDKEFLYCKVNGLCFECKKINKQIWGLAKEHPNHPKKENVTSSGSGLGSGSGSGLGSGSGSGLGTAKKKDIPKKKAAKVNETTAEEEQEEDIDKEGTVVDESKTQDGPMPLLGKGPLRQLVMQQEKRQLVSH